MTASTDSDRLVTVEIAKLWMRPLAYYLRYRFQGEAFEDWNDDCQDWNSSDVDGPIAVLNEWRRCLVEFEDLYDQATDALVSYTAPAAWLRQAAEYMIESGADQLLNGDRINRRSDAERQRLALEITAGVELLGQLDAMEEKAP